MGSVADIILVAAAFIVTIVVQVLASRIHWSGAGLILPLIVFAFSVWMLFRNLGYIRAGGMELDRLTVYLHFALYNIPTILFLCIYNYYQRMRISRTR